MHEFNDVIVRDGKLVLPDLSYPDGKHVRVVVTEPEQPPQGRLPISKVREILKGCLTESADLTEPMIPEQNWEMLKHCCRSLAWISSSES
jgi:hypothetical protein